MTRHGKEIAVVLSIDEYHRLGGEHRYPDFKDWLLNVPKVLTDDDMALFERSHEPDSREMPFADWE